LPNAYSELFSDTSGFNQYNFIIDTGGVTFDSQGNDDLVFRPGTSIVHSRNNNFNLAPMIIISEDY